MDTAESKLDWLSAFLMLIGLTMHFWGTAMNMSVLLANNGSMPATHIPEIASWAIFSDDGRTRHAAAGVETKFSFLADRIRIDLPDVSIRWESSREIIGAWAELVDYPLDRGTYDASIGDILRWAGSALFLLMIPILLVRIPFRLAQDGIRFHR